MKITLWITGVILGLIVMLGVAQTVASERVEVVELHTVDAEGIEQTTRLWVVDHDGAAYLRVGGDGSGWYDRLRANETVEVTRSGNRGRFITRTRPELSGTINALMQEKYTWGDSLIGALVGSREASIPIMLVPAR